ncbi:MAG: VWA domain-containing protein [Armatimonadetes bacterium]|nr:VWA domain-containing protein [Armatimonadota bacterium]
MEFVWPLMLWALALAPLLWWGHRLLGRRQQRAALQFAEPRLFDQLVVRPPGWQRSLPNVCYLIALLLLAVAMARPVAALPMPVNRAAVVIAVDTSRSMIATDAQPTRLDAARKAARALADMLPRSTRLGLVAFSEYGTVLLPPGTDRSALVEALDRLQPQSATSMGGGILEAVRVLPGRAGATGDRPSRLVPGSIVIFSDGVSNFGPNPEEAAALARDARVRIFTVGVGRPGGTVMRVEGQLVLVPFDAAGLQRIAQITGGTFFPATGGEDLRALSRMLGRDMGWEFTRQEASFLLLAVAGAFMLVGGVLSLFWFGRVP